MCQSAQIAVVSWKQPVTSPSTFFLFFKSTLVIPWLLYSPLDPRFTGLIQAGVDGFFSERKNPEYDFLQKGSKAVGPMS